MKFLSFMLAPVLAALVNAQSAPEFPLEVEENIVISYTDTETDVSPPGVLLPRSDVLNAPTVYRPTSATANLTYVVLMIDQDVIRNGTRYTLLHWLQPNLVATPEALSIINIMDGASTAVGASYVPPTPPADTGAHRYTFILFEQPSMWVIPASYVTINPPADTSARIGFNITDFVAASGLGEPVGANYLRVINGTAAETTSAASETFIAATSISSSVPSEATTIGTAASSADASATTEAASESSAVASETASATDGAVAVRGNAKELVIGLAMGVVGAGLWMM